MKPFSTGFRAGFLPYRAVQEVAGGRRALAVAALTLILGGSFLSGCAGSGPFAPNTPTGVRADTVAGSDPETAKANLFTQFSDIPIPSGADMNLADTLVLGGADGWLGRLSLDAGFGMAEMYTFYEREMPRFGWEQITTVRARISTMTYRLGERIATITLQSQLTGGTTVDFTVAPAQGAAPEGTVPVVPRG